MTVLICAIPVLSRLYYSTNDVIRGNSTRRIARSRIRKTSDMQGLARYQLKFGLSASSHANQIGSQQTISVVGTAILHGTSTQEYQNRQVVCRVLLRVYSRTNAIGARGIRLPGVGHTDRRLSSGYLRNQWYNQRADNG